MRVLLDGDIIAWKCAAMAGEDRELWLLRHQIINMTEGWALSAADEDADILVCLSKGRCFRYGIYPDYKKSRKDKPRPAMLADAFDILRHEFYIEEIDGLEGDDLLGIRGSCEFFPTVWNDDIEIMVTIDKDLLQIPGRHHNPDKDDFRKVREITREAASINFHVQWLMGDTTDSLPGIPKVGPVKAVKMVAEWLQNDLDLTTMVKNRYEEAGLSKEYCEQMRRCVRLLRCSDMMHVGSIGDIF